MAGGADYSWLNGRADSGGARARHVHRSHAHVPQVNLTRLCSILYLDLPRDAAANPIGHRVRRFAAARYSARRGSFGARRLDSERNSLSLRDHSQWFHGGASRAARSCALAWLAALAGDLESDLASSVQIDDSAARQ